MIDALLKKHKQPFLRWWLLISIIVITFVGLYVTGIIEQVYSVDVTKLSFLIFGLMAFMSIKCGYDTYRLTATDIATEKDIDEIYATAELGWFTSDFCLTLGMIGTVAGFLLMLNSAFADLNVRDVQNMQSAIADMAVGMSTALSTTLIGLICSILTKAQMVIIENSWDAEQT